MQRNGGGERKRSEVYEKENDMTSKSKRQGKPSQAQHHMCFFEFR
jgi:hypothetical protein